MPIKDYSGNTFVAFLDISGFKIMMQDDQRALKAMNKLYTTGYRELKGNMCDEQIDGIFISDCGILFARSRQSDERNLKTLLKIIRNINEDLLSEDIMLTTSVAYGQFIYEERIEFGGIEKKPIYGNAYVDAYFDNDNGIPKIQPGQCRIINNENLPSEIKRILGGDNKDDNIFSMIHPRNDNNHYYFYWMLQSPTDIDEFEKQYNSSYNLKYDGFLNALKFYAES